MRRGATLLELMISTGVFSLLVICVFAVFRFGKEEWKLTLLRHSLQNDGRKALIQLETDLRRSSYFSTSTLNSGSESVVAEGVTYPRHVLCFAGIDNWKESGSFDGTNNRPIWNVYHIYVATREGGDVPLSGEAKKSEIGMAMTGTGRFFRLTIFPPAAQVGPFPYPFLDNIVNDIHNGLGNIPLAVTPYSPGKAPQIQMLSPVSAFRVNLNQGLRSVDVTFQSLRKLTMESRGTMNQNRYEAYQLDLKIRPQNSYFVY